MLLGAVERWPFGLLVDAGSEGVPWATHLPWVADRANRRLLTPLAAANPQAERSDGLPVLAVFQGPHACMSPHDLGAPKDNVPTWSYAAVHVRGRARRLDGADARALASIARAPGRDRAGRRSPGPGCGCRGDTRPGRATLPRPARRHARRARKPFRVSEPLLVAHVREDAIVGPVLPDLAQAPVEVRKQLLAVLDRA